MSCSGPPSFFANINPAFSSADIEALDEDVLLEPYGGMNGKSMEEHEGKGKGGAQTEVQMKEEMLNLLWKELTKEMKRIEWLREDEKFNGRHTGGSPHTMAN
jgi:hypothetical protein